MMVTTITRNTSIVTEKLQQTSPDFSAVVKLIISIADAAFLALDIQSKSFRGFYTQMREVKSLFAAIDVGNRINEWTEVNGQGQLALFQKGGFKVLSRAFLTVGNTFDTLAFLGKFDLISKSAASIGRIQLYAGFGATIFLKEGVILASSALSLIDALKGYKSFDAKFALKLFNEVFKTGVILAVSWQAQVVYIVALGLIKNVIGVARSIQSINFSAYPY